MTSVSRLARPLWALVMASAIVATPQSSARSMAPMPSSGAGASPPVLRLTACTAGVAGPVSAPTASAAPGPQEIPRSELIVFGAASLRNAFETSAPALQADTGIAPLYSFDASSALRTQIEQGAPADVFASADAINVVTLLDSDLAVDPVVFACNQLTVIVPAGNPAGISSAADLGRPGVRIVAAGDEVPITRYAAQLVANLGIGDAYATNIVSREDNVAAVRARIELGEADAAIVYVTDAIASGDLVQQVPVPADANVPATYAAAIVAATDQRTASEAFLGWLTGPAGQAALAAFGFLPAP